MTNIDNSGARSWIGPYELSGESHEGAMAVVWKAWDPENERDVAIKEPKFDPRFSKSTIEEMSRRFVAEGRLALRLSHPNIVTVYDVDVWDNTAAIVMEYIHGDTLSKKISEGSLTPSDAVLILDQLLDAVDYAHKNGVIHRDIKPDNIFITDDGTVKLADFGIAHVEGMGLTIGTVQGAVLGSPGYMSPEQARGLKVDGRSDLFSVAVVGYEMLTGKNPFIGEDSTDITTTIYRIVHEPVPDLPSSVNEGLPADIRPVIMSGLSKSPDDRPPTAGEFKRMLHVRRKNNNLMYLAIGALMVMALVFIYISATGGLSNDSQPITNEPFISNEAVSAEENQSNDRSDTPSTAEDDDISSSNATNQIAISSKFAAEKASSSLPPDSVCPSYGPENLVDGDYQTAWNEGVAGNGVGEWVEFNSTEPVTVQGIRIMAGFNKNKNVYLSNHRPHEVTVTLSDGFSRQFELDDKYQTLQEIDLDGFHAVNSIRITVDSIYKGGQWDDTAISEIEIF